MTYHYFLGVSFCSHPGPEDAAFTEYCIRMQDVDGRICTARLSNGHRIPANGQELQQVCAEAVRIREELCKKYGITAVDFQNAVRRAQS